MQLSDHLLLYGQEVIFERAGRAIPRSTLAAWVGVYGELGLLQVFATLGFGRRQIAPALSEFARQFPDVEVQLHLTDRPVNLVEQGFDLQIRFRELPDARLTARLLARNLRVLYASPAYLQRAGEPSSPRELPRHADSRSHTSMLASRGSEARWLHAASGPVRPGRRTCSILASELQFSCCYRKLRNF